MFIRWLISALSKRDYIDKSNKVCPVIFSICEYEIQLLLDWIREHECRYTQKNKSRVILDGYKNDEIIQNGLMSMVFEQYGNDGNKSESSISIILEPSALGTSYKIRCKCGEEFIPGKSITSKKTA